MTNQAEKALKQLLALRKLTKETSTVTRRSQNQILQSLTDADLIVVSEKLEEHFQQHGW